MPHTLYTTEGIVIDSATEGEADKFLVLYTKEFGLVKAHARGVRWLKSKLRFSLQVGKRIDVTLVRGRRAWKIVSSQPKEDFFTPLSSSARPVFVRILSFVRRLVHGEEQDAELYDLLIGSLTLLCDPTLTLSDLRNLQALAVYRMLLILGYMDPKTSLPEEKRKEIEGKWSRERISFGEDVRRELVRGISASLASVQL